MTKADPRTIMILGSNGMVGSAFLRKCETAFSAESLIPIGRDDCDLRDQRAVFSLLEKFRPEWVILAAAKVGGIYANSNYPKDFIYDNLVIESNVIEAAYRTGVDRLLFLGSSCIYPKLAPQPLVEEALLTGSLESTNEPYAVAKIAGLKLCDAYNQQLDCDFRALMPTNIYGVNDNYHPENSHVIPGLIRRFHEAKIAGIKSARVWGSGSVHREFLFVDDLADAMLHIMTLLKKDYKNLVGSSGVHLNVGTGSDIPIKDLAKLIAEVVEYEGQIIFDANMPDGTPRKVLDVSRINKCGWAAKTPLREGLTEAYQDFQMRFVR